MEIGSAYRWMSPRLEAVAERSTSVEFKQEVSLAIETFERVKSLDGLEPSLVGLKPGDSCSGHEVMVSGRARLWDLGDRLHYRSHETTCSGLGETSASYDYNEPEGKVYVEKHRDTKNSYLSAFGRAETEQSFSLDLVTGTITDLTPWTQSVVQE